MREILFRGKRTDNGEWVEGYLTRRPSAIQYEAHYSPWFIDKPPSDPDDSGGFYNVDRETVGQFTGLTDTNGAPIFEGDIVAFYFFDKGNKNTRTMLIEWIESGFCMKELFRDYQLAKDFSIITGKFDTYRGEIKQGVYISNNTYFVEIIGNIHDNPELLNDEREGRE